MALACKGVLRTSPKATTAPIKKGLNAPTIKGLTDGVKERDVRVHDAGLPACPKGKKGNIDVKFACLDIEYLISVRS
jgi:hypothetical protein